jgi:hypothetical protein
MTTPSPLVDEGNISSQSQPGYDDSASRDASAEAEPSAEVALLRTLVWLGWHEMNAIRAATGSPRGYDGYATGPSEAWWSDMVEAMRETLGEDAKPWAADYMRPIIDKIAGRRPL